jgi:hypothetical protein
MSASRGTVDDTRLPPAAIGAGKVLLSSIISWLVT